jgi:predicted nucleic acid-binding protein
MKAAADASPLIFLARIGKLDVLDEYDIVYVPSEVLEEIEAGLALGHSEALGVRERVESGRLKVARGGRLRGEWNLDRGEMAVLAIALRRRVDEVIVDDRPAIAAAKFLGLRAVSVPFLLLRARRDDRLSQADFEQALRRLLGEGYYLSTLLYERLLQASRQT